MNKKLDKLDMKKNKIIKEIYRLEEELENKMYANPYKEDGYQSIKDEIREKFKEKEKIEDEILELKKEVTPMEDMKSELKGIIDSSKNLVEMLDQLEQLDRDKTEDYQMILKIIKKNKKSFDRIENQLKQGK